jgi:hypothetical protein
MTQKQAAPAAPETETLVFPVGVLLEVAKYLSSRPHGEVDHLIRGLRLVKPLETDNG